MLNSIILLGGLVSFFGLGAINPIQEKQDNTQFRLENHKSVQFDDDEQQITLTSQELNTYTWDNLADNISGFDLSDCYLLYNGDTFDFFEDDGEVIGWSYTEGTFIYFDYTSLKAFLLYVSSGNQVFEYSITIEIDDNISLYSDLKQAIELDIQANQPSSDNIPQVMSDFISVLISGISQLAGGLANGIVAMASALFLATTDGQVTGLSLFGGIIAIFAGLALAVGITTKVYNWVTSLGN